VHDLDRGERLHVQARARGADAAEHLEVVVELQPRVQPADDVDLGRAGLVCLARRGDDLLDGHLVGARFAALAVEAAKLAAQRADVRVVDVTVAVEVRAIAVQPLADEVGEPPDAVEVAAAVQRHAVRVREPFASGDLARDRLKRWVGDAHVRTHVAGVYEQRAARST
jgi:hypothetical protein